MTQPSSFKEFENRAIVGHNLDTLRTMPDGCIDCVVTSPPYFGLRCYGIPPVEWPEVTFAPMPGLPPMTVPAECSVHGLEKDLWAYVAHEVLVFREVRRVLAEHGVLFLNLGDSYSRNPKKGGSGPNGKHDYIPSYGDARRIMNESLGSSDGFVGRADRAPVRVGSEGLKEKDLCMVPERVALALQADGWFLRSKFPWIKGSAMPESVTDRAASAVEYFFMLAKSPRYYFDHEAVRKKGSGLMGGACFGKVSQDGPSSRRMADGENEQIRSGTRNWRNGDLWFESIEAPHGMTFVGDEIVGIDCNPQGTNDAHFATFGERLITPMILAGCPREVCTVCGKPRERITEKSKTFQSGSGRSGNAIAGKNGDKCQGGGDTGDIRKGPRVETQTIGWTACGCAYGLSPDDLEIIESPTGKRSSEDPSLVTGRAGMNRPRGPGEGTVPTTRYEQRMYSEQLRDSAYRTQMEQEAGDAFAHYIRTDHSGARPIRRDLLAQWLGRGWLKPVVLPPQKEGTYRPGRVFDPFLGSGTTAHVAAKLKRDWCGCEMNHDYVNNIAAYKIAEAETGVPVQEQRAGQLTLFGEKGA